jgi:hypothetical protein
MCTAHDDESQRRSSTLIAAAVWRQKQRWKAKNVPGVIRATWGVLGFGFFFFGFGGGNPVLYQHRHLSLFFLFFLSPWLLQRYRFHIHFYLL